MPDGHHAGWSRGASMVMYHAGWSCNTSGGHMMPVGHDVTRRLVMYVTYLMAVSGAHVTALVAARRQLRQQARWGQGLPSHVLGAFMWIGTAVPQTQRLCRVIAVLQVPPQLVRITAPRRYFQFHYRAQAGAPRILRYMPVHVHVGWGLCTVCIAVGGWRLGFGVVRGPGWRLE